MLELRQPYNNGLVFAAGEDAIDLPVWQRLSGRFVRGEPSELARCDGDASRDEQSDRGVRVGAEHNAQRFAALHTGPAVFPTFELADPSSIYVQREANTARIELAQSGVNKIGKFAA
jgi:hypothetical protein